MGDTLLLTEHQPLTLAMADAPSARYDGAEALLISTLTIRYTETSKDKEKDGRWDGPPWLPMPTGRPTMAAGADETMAANAQPRTMAAAAAATYGR